jgi:hypothetical protein
MLARIGVKFFQIVGVPSDFEWSQLQVVNSASMEEMMRGGGLSVLMSVEGDKASERGNEWLQAVVEGFLKNFDKDRVSWLKETVSWFDGVSGENDSLLLCIVLPHEGTTKRALYLAGKGGIRVYVSRGGAQKAIWNGDKGVSVVSGWLNDGDVVVAGTDQFIDNVWANLEGEVVDMVEEARGSIGAHERRGRMAGLVMILGKGEDENEEIEGVNLSVDEKKDVPEEQDETEVIEEPVVESANKLREIEIPQTDTEEKPPEDVEEATEVEIAKDDDDEKEFAPVTTAVEEMTESTTEEDTSIDENFKMVEQIVDEIPEETVEVKNEPMRSEVVSDLSNGMESRVLGGGSVGQLSPSNEKREKTRKIVVLLGILFLTIFVIALTFGVIKSRKDKEEKQFGEFINPIEYNLSEALKLKTVNQVRARALVEEARNKLVEGKTYEKSRFEQKYKDTEKKIEETWKEISGERGADGKLFADLGLIRDGFVVNRIVYDESWGFVALDKEKGSVALIDNAATMKIIAGGDKFKTTRSFVVSKKGGYFLTDDGVYLVDFKTQTDKKIIDMDSEIWSGVKEIGLFGSSVYLLDKIDIWKYPGLEDGVGKRQRWFKPGVEPDLNRAVDMKIATDIFVLTDSENIYKFASGTKDPFSLRQVNDHGTASRMAISEKKEEIYVLEKDKKRVVVYDMNNGEYKKQLIWETLSQVGDLVANDSMDKLFATIGGKMFEVVFQ